MCHTTAANTLANATAAAAAATGAIPGLTATADADADAETAAIAALTPLQAASEAATASKVAVDQYQAKSEKINKEIDECKKQDSLALPGEVDLDTVDVASADEASDDVQIVSPDSINQVNEYLIEYIIAEAVLEQANENSTAAKAASEAADIAYAKAESLAAAYLGLNPEANASAEAALGIARSADAAADDAAASAADADARYIVAEENYENSLTPAGLDESHAISLSQLKIDIDKVSISRNNVYRLYNSSEGRHLFSSNENEIDILTGSGWVNEGTNYLAPVEATAEVFRFYIPTEGRHFYTALESERDIIIGDQATFSGWDYEGSAFSAYSTNDFPSDAVAVVRYLNEESGNHVYSTSTFEQGILDQDSNWLNEGIAWYGNAFISQNDVHKIFANIMNISLPTTNDFV